MDGGVPSPVVKKMRGSLKSKGERRPEVSQDPQCWAIVPYVPPMFPLSSTRATPTARKCLPKPNAVRDCPPGMRIRGARPLRAAEPVAKNKMVQKPQHPDLTILSDSDSDGKKKPPPKSRGLHENSSSKVARRNEMGKAPISPVKIGRKRRRSVTEVPYEATAPELTSDNPRTRVKFVLKQFDNLRRQYLAAEQQRVKILGKSSGKKRADIKAFATLGDVRVNGTESIFGEVPGVEVGDHYYYRFEMFLISLHRVSQGGIDIIPASKSRFRDKDGKKVSIAVSVIASGGYEDDKDEGDTVIYTGQGGNNYIGDKGQKEDQELVRGNLALKNCCDLGLPVRFVRGCKLPKTPPHKESPSGTIYYYDGLYDVVDCFEAKGSSGYRVWKFKLVRKAGQGQLASSLVMFRGKALQQVLKDRGERVICEDISNGLEPLKVRVIGSCDDDRVPHGFQYITSLRYTPGLPRPLPPPSCSCDSECLSRTSCSCMKLNGSQPYNEDGALLRAKRLVYECGPHCRCRYDSKCINKVTQKGLRYDLEVFKTQGKGWGVRSTNFIPQGSFVCEYIGEVIPESDAEKRVSKDEYMFDLKIPHSMERRFGDVSGVVPRAGSGASGSSEDDDDADDSNTEKFTVDANRYGNLARFINHSCDPNLFVQCVLHDHHDHRFPHIMLFTSEHIPPYKELTYDYGYELNNIKVNGKTKVKNCYCGSRNCVGRLY